MKPRQVEWFIQITQLVRDTAVTPAHVCVLPKEMLLTSNSYNCEMHFNDRENVLRQRWGLYILYKDHTTGHPQSSEVLGPIREPEKLQRL